MLVLVVNAGSSSVKAQLMETENGKSLASAYCERVGIDGSFMTYKKNGEKTVITQDMPTHRQAFELFLNTLTSKEFGVISSLDEIKAVGHRTVNFGEKYNKSFVITEEALQEAVRLCRQESDPIPVDRRRKRSRRRCGEHQEPLKRRAEILCKG